jgi:4'-phosphopantetheinyl transferase EntD
MIEELLPGAAAIAEARGDEEGEAALFPTEREQVSRSVEKRQREFATGRACARRALERLGVSAAAIPSGEKGEPLWPKGVVGSITHCDGYRACAVARTADLLTVAIDAEPHQPLPEGLIGDVARAEERVWLRELARGAPDTHWDKLLFSAKESVYKAWFPLAERWLGFEDASLTVDSERRQFRAQLLVPGPVVAGSEVKGFSGRWLVADGLVITAIAVTA